jgi:hypothetical protein
VNFTSESSTKRTSGDYLSSSFIPESENSTLQSESSQNESSSPKIETSSSTTYTMSITDTSNISTGNIQNVITYK